jgi:hypothetical protein
VVNKAAVKPKRLIQDCILVSRNRLSTDLSTESVHGQMQAKYLVNGWINPLRRIEKKDAARRGAAQRVAVANASGVRCVQGAAL